MKKIFLVILSLVALFALVSCNKSDNKVTTLPPSNDGISEDEIGDIPSLVNSEKGNFIKNENGDYAVINIENYGEIVIKLLDNVAPDTVENFKSLVNKGFYDGLIFHRVVDGFIIEGGEMNEDGEIFPSDMIDGEFTSNGFENNLLHYRGVVSMSRTNIPDSAQGKFFIVLEDAHQLDSEYASFGYVACGMEVVDKIAKVTVDGGNRPKENIKISSVYLAVSENN